MLPASVTSALSVAETDVVLIGGSVLAVVVAFVSARWMVRMFGNFTTYRKFEKQRYTLGAMVARDQEQANKMNAQLTRDAR